MKNSYIISYRESTEYRKKNLISILNYLSWVIDSESEIILVEQDSESKINWLKDIKKSEKINHIFIKNSEIFNKGWGYNIGALNANGEVLIFHDSDIIIKLDSYRYCLSVLHNLQSKYDVVNPYNKIYYMDESQSTNFINQNYNFNNLPFNDHIEPGVVSGGIFMIKKDKFLNIKGFDEECYGYGHEDTIFDIKMKLMECNIFTLNNLCVHIFHDKSVDNYYDYIEKNENMYKLYKNMTKEELLIRIGSIDVFGRPEMNSNDKFFYEINKEKFKKQLSQKYLDEMLDGLIDNLIDDIVDESVKEIEEKIKQIIVSKIKDKLKEYKFVEEKKNGILKKIMNFIK